GCAGHRRVFPTRVSPIRLPLVPVTPPRCGFAAMAAGPTVAIPTRFFIGLGLWGPLVNLFRLDATNALGDRRRSASNRGETSDYASTLAFAPRGWARGHCDAEPTGNRPGTGGAARSGHNARSAADTVIRHSRCLPFGCVPGGDRSSPL